MASPSAGPLDRIKPELTAATSSGEEPTASRAYFENLDGLRFVAFFLVYLQHGFGVEQAAGAGVAFFFVLSGFLITHLILAEVELRGRVDVRAFYIRRALRIWPLYFAVLTFCFVVYPAIKIAAGLPGYIQNGGPLPYILFLGNFDVLRLPLGQGAGSTNVTWSVSVEEQFYVLWPILFRFVPPRRYLAIFLLVIGASFGFRLAHADQGPVLYFHSASVASDMAVGGLSAFAWRRSERLRRTFSTLSKTRIMVFYATGALLWYLVPSFWGPYTRLIAACLIAVIVLEQNFCVNSPFKMSRSRTLTVLGTYTYGLYMLHMIVLTLLRKSAELLQFEDRVSWRVISPFLGLLLSVAIAVLSFRYLEAPFLRFKDRYSRVR